MVAKTRILRNLQSLGALFNKSSSPQHHLFYSKLAIMELCGWIEEMMDDVVLKHAHRKLHNEKNINYLENEVVKKTYGFAYTEKHFRGMLVQLLGIVVVEKVERTLDAAKFTRFKAALELLHYGRNNLAHTHIRDINAPIDAPSVTIRTFETVYAGLRDFERVLKLL